MEQKIENFQQKKTKSENCNQNKTQGREPATTILTYVTMGGNSHLFFNITQNYKKRYHNMTIPLLIKPIGGS